LKKNYTISILDSEFSLLSDSPEAEVKEVISILEKETIEIKKKVSNLPQINILVLAALNIVNEYCQLKRTYAQKKEHLSTKISEVIDYIDTMVKDNDLANPGNTKPGLSLF
jgi:cell division protein ZapA (FtsZ GTPase activity inhibitor)